MTVLSVKHVCVRLVRGQSDCHPCSLCPPCSAVIPASALSLFAALPPSAEPDPACLTFSHTVCSLPLQLSTSWGASFAAYDNYLTTQRFKRSWPAAMVTRCAARRCRRDSAAPFRFLDFLLAVSSPPAPAAAAGSVGGNGSGAPAVLPPCKAVLSPCGSGSAAVPAMPSGGGRNGEHGVLGRPQPLPEGRAVVAAAAAAPAKTMFMPPAVLQLRSEDPQGPCWEPSAATSPLVTNIASALPAYTVRLRRW